MAMVRCGGAPCRTQRLLTRCLPLAQRPSGRGAGFAGPSPAPVVAGTGRTGGSAPWPWQASPCTGRRRGGFGDAAAFAGVVDRDAARHVCTDQLLERAEEDVVPVGAHRVEVAVAFALPGGDQRQAASARSQPGASAALPSGCPAPATHRRRRRSWRLRAAAGRRSVKKRTAPSVGEVGDHRVGGRRRCVELLEQRVCARGGAARVAGRTGKPLACCGGGVIAVDLPHPFVVVGGQPGVGLEGEDVRRRASSGSGAKPRPLMRSGGANRPRPSAEVHAADFRRRRRFRNRREPGAR